MSKRNKEDLLNDKLNRILECQDEIIERQVKRETASIKRSALISSYVTALVALGISSYFYTTTDKEVRNENIQDNISYLSSFVRIPLSWTTEDITIESTGKLDASKVKYSVIIQGGHDGRKKGATGTSGKYVREKVMTRKIGVRAVKRLNELGITSGYAKADSYPDNKTLLFISLHFDGSNSKCSLGSTVGYSNKTDKQAVNDWMKIYKDILPSNIKLTDMNVKNKNLNHYYAFSRMHTYDAQMLIEFAELTCPAQETWAIDNTDKLVDAVVRFAQLRIAKTSNVKTTITENRTIDVGATVNNVIKSITKTFEPKVEKPLPEITNSAKPNEIAKYTYDAGNNNNLPSGYLTTLAYFEGSKFNRLALSPSGASGLYQYMDETALENGLISNGVDNRTDIKLSTAQVIQDTKKVNERLYSEYGIKIVDHNQHITYFVHNVGWCGFSQILKLSKTGNIDTYCDGVKMNKNKLYNIVKSNLSKTNRKKLRTVSDLRWLKRELTKAGATLYLNEMEKLFYSKQKEALRYL